MALRRSCCGWALRGTGLAGLLIGVVLCGCNKQPQNAEAGPPTQSTAGASGTSPGDHRLDQSFDQARANDPPEDVELPPTTMTGKSLGTLYEKVVQTWDTIHFVAASGKRLVYTATLDTEFGEIDITLLPDVAPNHVRSFLALAKAGYYDGLVFERIIHQEPPGAPENKVELIEGGCPLGIGGEKLGSIGYWLKPEFNTQLHHEEGTVGACHGEEPDSAACRFYIMLSKAPVMDGQWTIFGKVTRGLDLVRRISTQPVLNAQGPDAYRPEHPVVIRKVTVQTKEVDAPPGK